ncbi:MAG: protein-L-isoaspartate(D-aspartate) O-methyltransferase, partial [Pseudomonadota bacterium]|nr:protein-L-isoaspartate(D-aspartate) O-methyltransferase [Pseudomonadota bacterium]
MDPLGRLIAEIEAEARVTGNHTGRPVLSPRVLAAMRQVRREAFMPPSVRAAAHDNLPQSIGHGQTISQPFIVALMTDLLDLEPQHSVLEIGTGSGYQAAVLAALARQVWTVEAIAELARQAREALAVEAIGNVEVRTGDGAQGWPEHAPYDAVIVTAAARAVPPALIDQLRSPGRLVIPVGPPHGAHELMLIEKGSDGGTRTRSLLDVAFVP